MLDVDNTKADRDSTSTRSVHRADEDAVVNYERNGIEQKTGSDGLPDEREESREGTPPPLPPRPRNLELLNDRPSTAHALTTPRPKLSSKATTALSFADAKGYGGLGAWEPSPSPASRQGSIRNFKRNVSRVGSEMDDSASFRSSAPTFGLQHDMESLLGETTVDAEGRGRKVVDEQSELELREKMFPEDRLFDDDFSREFDDVEALCADGSNEEAALNKWKMKLKHFLIISAAGKPIYSRHGDDQLVSNYVGVMQAIISFYQGAKDELRGISAGGLRIVVLSKDPLYLVAISRLEESDVQLRAQLDALYMQILSTLTLPTLQRIFSHRPSSDLRRPLQGTDKLLSALADGFTRGSPSTLLSALECLKLKRSCRQVINNAMLKARAPNLLYGLIVAGGRLVSVVRPKKHSLHPGDLHLLFNMLFEAGGVKAGGGENWIPVCLPGFNKTGYLYMYVSFLNLTKPNEEVTERSSTAAENADEVAILLISANRESFYELRKMRLELAELLEQSDGMQSIREAIQNGRPPCTGIVPGTGLCHFLYKSRANVQFTMPSYEPYCGSLPTQRRLFSIYHSLHADLHARPSPLKILHSFNAKAVTLSWSTAHFELYCVASATTSRAAIVQAANRIIQWVRREEERIFIIGGAVF